ncbi:CSC1-like protein ERD4 [Seminavis robusta]|uniref:CSC1-like protein ERD4 n=1 Tax=Seminavis robusta TaxID=568900 RepID=A0A9N8HHA3_9STRA|nr:CSC1-like protein ERD4 [Seminavis robusta]|eukprot:Sro624_g177340.1 CSC1-like protein ERD4 (798) ;mRNA; f:30390-32953
MTDPLILHRFLQEGGANSATATNAPTTADAVEPTSPNDTAVLVNTLLIYGILFIIISLLFCWLRLRNPRVYNIRGWVKDIRCKLAKNQFGFFSWVFELNDIPDKQFMEQCGMDALCLVKILRWAFKVSAVSALNALWLIPVYGSSKDSPETAYITDYIASITVSHVPPGSPRLIATTIATYIVFGAALYFLYQEFDWFRQHRFRWLHQAKPRNYTVYVHGIRDEFKADYDLADYFQESFGLGRVQEAHLRLDTPELLEMTMKRQALIKKLEHAINIQQVKNETPTHKVNGVQVDSIEAYADELQEMNREITERIEFLEIGGYDSDDTEAQMMESARHAEGGPLDGGFLTFYNLSSTQAARQMNHARMPFEMQVWEAPDPEDVLWPNVGKKHAEIQVGKLTSLVLTITICLLWTIPISFFSGLSSVEGMEEQFDFIKEANEKYPALRAILAQLAPFLVVIVNALLPVILKALSVKECHISNGAVQASLFTKLSYFMVIQTFFVSALAGSLVSQLSLLAEQPTLIVEVLANELPTKSTFFIQLVFISTVLGLGIELLRVVPVIMASLRGCLGPNLTEKERNQPWLFFNPLAVPPVFNHASVLSNVVLFCMILFVYAVIAPLTAIFMVLSFLVLAAGYRHQLIYIYPATQESGGRLWMSFVGIILNCMLVAEIVIIGLLALKQSAVAAILVAPVIAVTMLFKSYINQRHFQSMECLPSHECHRKDISSDFYITESFEDLYVQPELLVKEAFPENASGKLRKMISLVERRKPSKKKKRRKRGLPQEVKGGRGGGGTPPASI